MTKNEAIEVLTHANKWRRDNEGVMIMPDVRQLGIAIDYAINFIKDTI